MRATNNSGGGAVKRLLPEGLRSFIRQKEIPKAELVLLYPPFSFSMRRSRAFRRFMETPKDPGSGALHRLFYALYLKWWADKRYTPSKYKEFQRSY